MPVCTRVGSTNRRADRDLIEELRRCSREESFDERALPDLDSEAIDFRAASESFAPFRKLRRNDMETLRLITTHQGRKVPTVGGLLLFGKDRAHHFPDAWIQVGRFRGTEKAHLFDHAEIRSFRRQDRSTDSGQSRRWGWALRPCDCGAHRAFAARRAYEAR
jgi:ATP-dependent DNA helicase RecG